MKDQDTNVDGTSSSTLILSDRTLNSSAKSLNLSRGTLDSSARTLNSSERVLNLSAEMLNSSENSAGGTLNSSERTLNSSAKSLNSSAKSLNSSARTLEMCKWPWKRKVPLTCNYWTSISRLIVFSAILCHLRPTLAHPLTSSQSDCDWNGRGALTPGSRSIQTMTFGCTRGRVHWEDPSGGLRVEIRPTMAPPYRLCLEDRRGGAGIPGEGEQRAHHRVLLEEGEGRLLRVLSTHWKNSDCYQIRGPSAILYVETGDSDSRPISLSYEVEPLRGDGDPCRPCSEAEILKSYCSSDVVARGSIVQIVPGVQYDSIYVKSDLVIHQNQPVFTPYHPPMVNFLSATPTRFDMDRPQRVTRRVKGREYQGIIAHPSVCAAAAGEGDFLWLVRFRFGMAVTQCVTYWDQWAELASRSQGECPLSPALSPTLSHGLSPPGNDL